MKKILATITIVSLLTFLALLFLTNPLQSGPIGILAVFISLYITVLGCLAFSGFYVSKLLSERRAMTFLLRRPLERMSLLHSYYYASVIALAPVMLLGMGSVGKTGVGEVLLVIIFVVAACVYVRKMTTRTR